MFEAPNKRDRKGLTRIADYEMGRFDNFVRFISYGDALTERKNEYNFGRCVPVSSSSSRIAACSGDSPSSMRPSKSMMTIVFRMKASNRTCRKLCARGLRGRINISGLAPAPMTTLSMGGRYCSIMTVERGNASVFDLRMARTATAIQGDKMKSPSGYNE